MYTRKCQVCDTKSTTCCYSRGNRTPKSEKKQTSVHLMNENSWHDLSRMICTKNDTNNCQVCDTKSTTWCYWRGNRTPESEKSRRRYISWMKVVGMIDYVWYALKMIPGTARYAIRDQPHDVHDRSHIIWYVYQELPGMWNEINPKQQKMP